MTERQVRAWQRKLLPFMMVALVDIGNGPHVVAYQKHIFKAPNAN